MTISAEGRFGSRITLLGASVAAMIAILGGCGVTSSTGPTPSLPTIAAPPTTPITTPTSPRTSPAGETDAATALAKLRVKGRAPMTGYSRAQFLPDGRWVDTDGNGCDQHDDTLARDLTAETRSGCRVSGTLVDPYTGHTLLYSGGSAVQVDHVVALADAWQTGAQALDGAHRLALASDPVNLQATDGPTNMRKGAGDAATWLPPNKAYRCTYVSRQISVKTAYGLWLTQAEHDAMVRVLGLCSGQQLPETSQREGPATAAPSTRPPPVPAPPPKPAPAPQTPAPASVYFPNCDAARAAGVAPMQRGDAGYRSALDRDGNGVACQ